MNYVAKLNFGNSLASTAAPKVIKDLIREALKDQHLWAKVEPYALPPGVCGSKSFDQANIVREIKDADAKKGGHINAIGLSDRVLWNHVYTVLQQVFQCSHGRVLGLLEDKRGQSSDGTDGNGNGGDIE